MQSHACQIAARLAEALRRALRYWSLYMRVIFRPSPMPPLTDPDREVPIPRHRLRSSPLIRGIARLVDIGATLDRRYECRSQSPAAADAGALAGDWARIGGDMTVAIERAARESGVSREAALDAATRNR